MDRAYLFGIQKHGEQRDMPPRTEAAELIKKTVTMLQLAESYGFEINRSGFIHCPFHAGDHSPSLKIYPEDSGFHCFGCGASGSVIDFTMRLFNLSFMDAVKKLNQDFSLGMNIDNLSREEISAIMRQRKAEQRKRLKADAIEIALFDQGLEMQVQLENVESAIASNPPTREGWQTSYPSEWIEAVKRRTDCEAEYWRNLRADMYFKQNRQLPSDYTEQERRELVKRGATIVFQIPGIPKNREYGILLGMKIKEPKPIEYAIHTESFWQNVFENGGLLTMEEYFGFQKWKERCKNGNTE